MQQHQRRSLLHHLALSDQPGAFHIEVQSDPIHDHAHPHILPDTRGRHRIPRSGCRTTAAYVVSHTSAPLSQHRRSARCSANPPASPSRIATRGSVHTASADRRHTYVTQLTEDGVDRRFIQEQVGHRCDTSTAIYTHVSGDFMNTALRKALTPAFTPTS
ncbi:tyrosine-type recombinase/integrase [Actinoplanes sp. NPDC051343]|uniref:tyrosine-type recombinase/integrase n=1 Tax=Actinoplanes sp. NPDC051343 TaxID=3363906 RepID=UPI0037A9AB2C